MKMLLILLLFISCTPRQETVPIPTQLPVILDCSFNGHQLYGRVQIVNSFPDVKVRIVNSFPDLKVQLVESFPNSCGKWELVESFPDIKVQIVDNFEDIKIEFVESFPGEN